MPVTKREHKKTVEWKPPECLNAFEIKVARAWMELEKAKNDADKLWAAVRKKTKRLARIAQLRRKKLVLVRIDELHAVKITNQFLGEEEVFSPSFGKKYAAKRVKMDAPEEAV